MDFSITLKKYIQEVPFLIDHNLSTSPRGKSIRPPEKSVIRILFSGAGFATLSIGHVFFIQLKQVSSYRLVLLERRINI